MNDSHKIDLLAKAIDSNKQLVVLSHKIDLLAKAIDSNKQIIVLENRKLELLGQMLKALEYKYEKAKKDKDNEQTNG